ncbi:unnamed protein product [Effrenium voratum]|uniref:Uncharacterized protein n=1 Tax=Effrenium voratum TaxID=2562239 RepID=A0AA36I703_9DINO|nr:unnamed protein product [Effrenium voratum]
MQEISLKQGQSSSRRGQDLRRLLLLLLLPYSLILLRQQLPKSQTSDQGEALHGSWKSEKGKCSIGKDPVTARLSYTEPLPEGERVHGWLDATEEEGLWQGTLVLLQAGEGPWYGPSFGPPPEVVGDIKVRLLKGEKPQMETQIRMKEEDEDWSEPTKFELEEGVEEKPMPKPDLSNLLPAEDREKEVEPDDSDDEVKRAKCAKGPKRSVALKIAARRMLDSNPALPMAKHKVQGLHGVEQHELVDIGALQSGCELPSVSVEQMLDRRRHEEQDPLKRDGRPEVSGAPKEGLGNGSPPPRRDSRGFSSARAVSWDEKQNYLVADTSLGGNVPVEQLDDEMVMLRKQQHQEEEACRRIAATRRARNLCRGEVGEARGRAPWEEFFQSALWLCAAMGQESSKGSKDQPARLVPTTVQVNKASLQSRWWSLQVSGAAPTPNCLDSYGRQYAALFERHCGEYRTEMQRCMRKGKLDPLDMKTWYPLCGESYEMETACATGLLKHVDVKCRPQLDSAADALGVARGQMDPKMTKSLDEIGKCMAKLATDRGLRVEIDSAQALNRQTRMGGSLSRSP